jgi:hypothetical protein
MAVLAPSGRSLSTINRTAFLAFVSRFEVEDGDGTRLFNGRQISETRSRALHRWRVEGASPDIFSVDTFLVHIGIHLDEFFDWCEEMGIEAWQFGEPDWHKEEPDWEEINRTWVDPPVN